jgi:puromycin-sensitive aminopeptidase
MLWLSLWQVAVKTLPFYKDYFKIAYPLPKMDLIAIQDFAAGAMENWGLVTYRERLLLVNPASSTITKQLVALVVGHELAHQWFGNLVTMEWWTHLWLNEGFATWIEYLCVDHTHPEYEIWTNFLSREYASAMSLDALASSHPIEVPVGPPSEVEEIFDAISYCKGSCVIRMLHEWIGQESFQKGLNTYLTTFAYKNASTGDLWAHLETASGKPVADVMSTWTQQLGYPVITVEAKQEGGNRVLTLSQRKFCGDGNITGFESMLWKVPIVIATKGNPQAASLVLTEQSTTVTLEGVGEGDWVLVNPEREGFYRVSYSSELFQSLTPALTSHTLSPRDRLGLQNDAFAMARSGVGSTVDVLALFASYSTETSYTVWESLAGNLATISRLLSHTDYYPSFKAYAQKIFEKAVARLGWDSKDSDTPLESMLRSLVIGAHGKYGNQATIEEAKARFQKHVEGTAVLPSDLKSAVFSMAMANGDETTFDQLVKLHAATDSNEEQVRIYRSLGAGKTEALTKKCLEFAVSDKVRPNDLWSVLFSARQASPRSRDMVWEFVQEKWTWLKERYQGSFLLGRVVEVATSGFVTEEKAVEVETFFKSNPAPSTERVVKQNCEAIRLNAKWLERDSNAIQEWLKNH